METTSGEPIACTAAGLREPLERRQRQLLRQAVRDYVREERRYAHPPVLHVGVPGAETAAVEVDPRDAGDHGLRTDVVAALRARALGRGARPDPDELVWLTRRGDAALQDVDVQWLAAAWSAYAEAGAELTFVVVTRRGWRDPRSGAARSWVRVRPGRAQPVAEPGADPAG